MELKILALPSGNGKVYSTTDKLADYIKLGYVDTGETIEVEVTDPSKEVVEMLLEDSIVTHLRYKGDNEWRAIAGGGSGTDTYKVKVDGTDTAAYLENKLVQGTNIVINKASGKMEVSCDIADELPVGGATGQVLAKKSATDGDVEWVNQSGGSGAGVTVYADLTAIKAVDTTSTTSGTLAQVVTLGQYEFISTSTATGDDVRVIQPTTGSGRWLLQSSTAGAVSKITTTKSGSFGTVDSLQVEENSIIKELCTVPVAGALQTIKKKIVTIGDSNMAGEGLADKTTRYIYQLKTYLETNKGYILKDVSVGGNTTTAMANRFHTDIAPEKPDLVIISTSLPNLGFAPSSEDDTIQTLLAVEKIQILKLIQLCKSIKSDYLILGAYPCNSTSSLAYNIILKFNAMMQEIIGERYINVYGMIDSGTGTVGSLFDSGDHIHFNLNGHNAIYAMLRKLDFDKYGLSPNYLLINKSSKGIIIPNDTANYNGMYIKYPNLFLAASIEESSSFTFGFEISPNINQSALAVLAHIEGTSGQQAIQIFIDTNKYVNVRFRYSGGATTTILSTTTKLISEFPNKLRLIYNPAIRKVVLVLNGVSIGTQVAIAEDFINKGSVYIGCAFPSTNNAVGFSYRHIFMYRTSLTVKDVLDIDAGKLTTSSLMFYNPINGASSSYINYAPTGAYINSSVWGATLTDGAFSDNDYSTAEKTKLANIGTVGTAAASATSITAPSTVFHVTGTTAISTITVPYTGFTGKITIIPDGVFTFDIAGNIAEAYTATVNRAIDLVYDGTKWYRV